MESEAAAEEQIHKKGRHRKKHLYNSILRQMEFYFSSSNLLKDRYLAQLMQTDPFIDISIFLNFNKIRKLTLNIEDIKKAISKSEIIELSEDKSKVRRKLPIKINESVDECTIYVERLKSDVTHDWLTGTFSEFGNVVYVSIPRYKNTGVVKGFAFVEFENEEGAKAALQYFESIDCKIPSFIEPQKLCSIATFEGSQDNKQSIVSNYEILNETKGQEIKEMETENDIKKRKAENDLEIQQSKKKIKLNNQLEIEPIQENKIECKKKKKLEKVHKKKMKEMGLLILSKNEWKKMRNRYLNMQRKTMKELKQHLNSRKFANCFEEKQKEVTQKEPEVSQGFISGIIAKLQLSEACVDNKKLKEEIKTNIKNVKFIDIPLPINADEIFLRFETPNDAKEFCKSNFKGKSYILSGDEEQNYWNKIEKSRFDKQQRSAVKQRGRDKLLKKAEKQAVKHIHFDDND